MYTIGTLLHVINVSPWWTVVGGLLFTVSMVVATMAKHVRVLGIAYSATLSLAITAWLTYATTTSTFTVFDWNATKNNAIGIGVGAIPFIVVYAMLIHDRDEARTATRQLQVQLRGEKLRWHEACAKAGIKGWYWHASAPTQGGQIVTMQIKPGGTPVKQARNMLHGLEVSLSAPYDGALRIEQGVNSAFAEIHWNERNMLAETIPLQVDTTPQDLLDVFTYGMHEDRQLAQVTHGYRSVLNVGQRDGGKSNKMNVDLINYLRCPNVLIFLLCFKQGATAKPYLQPYATGDAQRPAFDWVGTTIPEMEAMLEAADAIGNARAKRRVGDKIVPSPQTPAIRIVIDEIADVMADPRYLKVQQKLIQVLRKHRSEGIDLDLGTQRATMSFLGAHARDIASQVSVINCFRLSDASEVFNTLNLTKDRVGGVDPSAFSHNGTVLTIADEVRKAPIKVFRVDNAILPSVAMATAHLRPQLEEVDVAAAGSPYARRWQSEAVRELLIDAARTAGRPYRPAHITIANSAVSTPPAPAPSAPEANQDAGQDEDGGRDNVIPLHKTAPPAAGPVLSALGITFPNVRDMMIRQYGPVEGERRYQHARGVMALRTMRKILAQSEGGKLPTREILDQLAVADTAKYGDLDGKSLAALLAPRKVAPKQLGTSYHPTNPRGYELAAVEAALRELDGPAAIGSGSA